MSRGTTFLYHLWANKFFDHSLKQFFQSFLTFYRHFISWLISLCHCESNRSWYPWLAGYLGQMIFIRLLRLFTCGAVTKTGYPISCEASLTSSSSISFLMAARSCPWSSLCSSSNFCSHWFISTSTNSSESGEASVAVSSLWTETGKWCWDTSCNDTAHSERNGIRNQEEWHILGIGL